MTGAELILGLSVIAIVTSIDGDNEYILEKDIEE